MSVVVALALAAAGYWNFQTQRDAARTHGESVLRTTLGVLEGATYRAGEENNLADLRQVVIDVSRSAKLSVCRIRLSSGATLADADIRKNEIEEIPEHWSGSAASPSTTFGGGECTIVSPFKLGTRGEGVIEVSGAIPGVSWANLREGCLVVAGGAAVLLIVGWRMLRRVLLALGGIGQALGAASSGEIGAGALRVSEKFGPAAKAWNDLVAERETLRRSQALRAADDAASGLGGGARETDLATACDAMWAGVLLLDQALCVKYCNGAAATFLRVRREELAGADLRKHVKDAPVLEALEATAHGKVKHRTSVETTRASESVPGQPANERTSSVLRFSVKPARHDDAGTVMVIIEDVTQQRVADESRNAFVAQATHELRTPLTNIRLYLDTLIEAPETDAPTRNKCMNVISQEARRLERIVGDMLSISEIEAGSLKLRKGDVRLEELLKDLHEDYRAQAEDKDMQFEVLIPPKLPVLHADRDKVALALHNLIGNAIKYTPAGGRVTVRTAEGGGRVRVQVVDNGIGVRPEEQELIFEKFYRAKDKRVSTITGSGLGLALVRDIARMHGGDVTLESEIDRGSTFTLDLPVEEPMGLSKAA